MRMAEATHAIADLCDDNAMIEGYCALAAQWVRMAEEPPRPVPNRD